MLMGQRGWLLGLIMATAMLISCNPQVEEADSGTHASLVEPDSQSAESIQETSEQEAQQDAPSADTADDVPQKGDVAFVPEIESTEDERLYGAMLGRKGGYINKEGEWVIPPIFGDTSMGTGIYPLQYKVIFPVLINGKWGAVNKDGFWIVPPINDYVWQAYPGDIVFVISSYDDGAARHYGADGNEVENQDLESEPVTENQLIPKKVDEKWGYVNSDEDWCISPQFRRAYEFSEDLAAVMDENEKIGYIDRQGNWVIEAKFTIGRPFSEDLAGVLFEEKWGFIDKGGNWVIEPQFGIVGTENIAYAPINLEHTYEFINGLAIVHPREPPDNRYFGYIDKAGNYVIPPEYGFLEPFDEHGVAFAAINTSIQLTTGTHGYIDRDGNWIINWDIYPE